MALITLPTKFGFSRIERFGLTRRSNSLRSRYTGQGQTVVYPYAVWEFEGTLIEYDGPEAAAIRAFLVDLEGQKNTFRLPVPGYNGPSTGFKADVMNLAVAQRATSITMTNWPDQGPFNNQPLFKKGDYFSIGAELKMVTENVTFDAAGQAVVNFKPATRKAYGAGFGVNVVNPYCTMRAVEDDVASWAISAPVRQSSKFEAIEAVDI